MRRGSRGGFGATARARMLRNNVGRMDAASKGFGAGRLDAPRTASRAAQLIGGSGIALANDW
jgi:hypothetical protein